MVSRRVGILILLLTVTGILSACQYSLNKDLEEYESAMQPIYDLDESYKDSLNSIDFKQVESLYAGSDINLPQEEVDKITQIINEELIPISVEMSQEIEKVEIQNDEIQPIHDEYKESIKLKEDFANQLGQSISLYSAYVNSTNQLIEDGESVGESKKERDALINSNHNKKEKEEIDAIVEIINSKSDDLEREANKLQNDTPANEKKKQIEGTLLPLLDEQIESVNQLVLETKKGKEVRAITLEMFYTFKSYYNERVNFIQIYEKEQEVQVQKILPLIDTFNKIDESYRKNLDKLKTREK